MPCTGRVKPKICSKVEFFSRFYFVNFYAFINFIKWNYDKNLNLNKGTAVYLYSPLHFIENIYIIYYRYTDIHLLHGILNGINMWFFKMYYILAEVYVYILALVLQGTVIFSVKGP